uniref:Uncharacterized protein n=1 Tax=Stomoxys calcitrans TaxID=35570 RepID=A0A1I8Q958_STOCA
MSELEKKGGPCRVTGSATKTKPPDYATEVERLVLLTYPGESQPWVDRMKIETFVNGTRGPEIKCATYASQKATFAKTVSFAFAQETARIMAKPQIYNVRYLDTEYETF